MRLVTRGLGGGAAILIAVIVACCSPRPASGSEFTSVPTVTATQAAPSAAFARLPLAFEPNTGQAPWHVRYLSYAAGYRLSLTDTAARFAAPGPGSSAGDTFDLRWIGAAATPTVAADDQLPGKAHYFTGPDASHWRRDVPMYGRITYRGIYPGVDLVFHGSQQDAEFDFVVAPGGDPRRIRLELAGADSIALEADDLIAARGAARLRLHKPVVYQDGPSGRVPVDGRFRLHGRHITFEVGAYDRARPLVIDPVLTYSTYLGPAASGVGIGVDAAQNMYVALPDRVVKLSADGSTLLYSSVLGDARPAALAVDGAGNAYVAGSCPYPRSGLTFNCATTTALAAGRPTAQGDVMGLVWKLRADGSLVASTTIGGNGTVLIAAIAVDASSTIYITGRGSAANFPQTRPPFARPGVTATQSSFVQAIAADFSRYVYAVVFATGSGTFDPRGIAVDRTGAAAITGTVLSDQFPTTAGAFQPTSGPGGGAVVAKIAADASTLVYATYVGDTTVSPGSIAMDGDGNAYITGHAGAGLPTANALQPTSAGAQDAFVTKLNATGSALVFSTYLGGSLDDAATGIVLDGVGTIYVAGGTDSTDFPQRNPLPSAFGSAGSNFVTALTPAGNAFVYSTYFADTQTFVTAMTATSSGTVYLTGSTTSAAYPTVRPFQAAPSGTSDAFIARIEPGTSACATGQFFAEYFSNIALTPPATRTACESTINNNYGAGGPAGLPVDNFSVRWTGRFPFAAGSVTFTARADDGVRVFLDGVVIIDQWHDQPATTYTATRNVTAGEHEVKVEYYERGGDAVIQVSWAAATAGCATGQFFAEYFSNIALTPPATRTACETAVNYDWGAGGPAGLPTDNFSARWTGQFSFAGGNVTFTARADDGVRVFLDGVAIIDQWHDQAPTIYTAVRAVTAGVHEVKVEYYEHFGGAVAQVSWTGSGGTTAPTLTTLTPSSATVGGPAFTLTADGSNFVSGATVLWNGAARTTTFVSATRLTASIPASDIAAAGSAAVTVRNPDGQISNALTFTINPSGGGTFKVIITAPASGATVRGTVWFTVWIEGAAAGTKTYTLSVGGSTITSTQTTSNGPVSLPWTTTAADNGARTATVTVRDSANASGQASITLTVSN